jgi:hypothetical protein
MTAGRPRCIVPLAGPDVIGVGGALVPLRSVDGQPMIRRALESRAWARRLAGEDYTFVLRDLPEVADLDAFLRATWPGCGVVRLSRPTGGALFSALAGLAMVPADAGPIVVDLADILFDGDAWRDPWPASLGGVTPYFQSRDARFSYLRLDGDRVLETVEKRMISDAASAGVYLFRDVGVLLAAAAHSVAHRESLAHKDALFVCPTMNGVVAQGLDVVAVRVEGVRVLEKA